ncbi:Son of sevenless 2 [Ceratobasidium sp. 392]|nr:Son of sevenless 2 [Ceratobasidium sp. 392]
MAALVAEINSLPIRRLKRTWGEIQTRSTNTLNNMDRIIDSGNDFKGYRQQLKQADGPCVPFLGVHLMALTSIQDGNKISLSKELSITDVGERQKTANIIQEIQRHQAKQYNLALVDEIQIFIRQSLSAIDEKENYWNRSLDVEPPEKNEKKIGM